MTLPTFAQVQKLHQTVSPSEQAFKIVFSHCEIVAEICSFLASNDSQIKRDLVVTGALLHDIGAYAFINVEGKFFNEENYIQHGIIGYARLHDAGLPEVLCRFAKYHTGVGITKAEVLEHQLPLPQEDYLPGTVEESLVMYADKFHSKTPKFHQFETYRESLRKFPRSEDKQQSFDLLAKRFGKPPILEMAERYHQTYD